MRLQMKNGCTTALVLILGCLMVPVFGLETSHVSNDVDVLNLESEIPSCVEDAYVLPDDHYEAQTVISWGDADFGDWWEYRLQLAAGLKSNWQATAGMVWKDNNRDNTGDGDLFLKFMRQCHKSERDAALFGVSFNFPTGQDYASMYGAFPPFNFMVNEREERTDIALQGVYTRILRVDKPKRLHFEVKETFVRSAPPGFAKRQLFLGTAYDTLLRENTLAIASLCWIEGSSICNHDSSVLQLGLRHKESNRFLWGGGLRLGLDWAAANWGLVAGAQYDL